jgi:hypothetical protein
MMILQADLTGQMLDLVDTFRRHRPLAESVIGLYAVGDSAFLKKLRKNGAKCTIVTVDEFIHWFDQNWPDGAEWPASVRRPSELTKAS